MGGQKWRMEEDRLQISLAEQRPWADIHRTLLLLLLLVQHGRDTGPLGGSQSKVETLEEFQAGEFYGKRIGRITVRVCKGVRGDTWAGRPSRAIVTVSCEIQSWNGKQNKDEACRQVVWGGGRVKRVVKN